MRSAVDDILSERAALAGGGTPAVLASLLIHGSAAALAIYIGLHHPPATLSPTLKIKFAPMPPLAAPIIPANKMPAKAPQPRITEPRPEPVKPPSPAKVPERNTVPISPFGKSAKKGSETPEPPKPKPVNAQPVVPVTATAIAPGATGVTALEGGDFPYTLYIERMKTLIGGHWFRPQTAAGTTTIYFVIDRDGSIRDAKVETSSSNSTFDRAALRAILETSPLPTLPFAYNGTYLGVHLTFR